MFDSSYAYDSLRVAVKAAFDAKIINGKLELTSEQTKIISEADLKIAIISGDGSYSVKTVIRYPEVTIPKFKQIK